MTLLHPIDHLLDKSLTQYAEMCDLLANLKDQLENHAAVDITTMLDQFNVLGKEARLLDARIEEQLRLCQPPLSERIEEKLAARKDKQSAALRLVEENVIKAATIKSCLTNEFHSVRRGRKAISSYKSNVRGQGRIVNKSF